MKRLHKKLDFPFRRALAVLLAAAMTFALTGCSVRELHIGQVEVNTGAGTAWITPARGVDRFDIPAADFSAGADGSVTYTGTAYRVLQCREAMQAEQSREPTLEEVARRLELPLETVNTAMDAISAAFAELSAQVPQTYTSDIGSVVGTHAGPGATGIAYFAL